MHGLTRSSAIQGLTRSSAVTGRPALLLATTILPSRSRMSRRSEVKARTAMISLATVMSNWVWKRHWRRFCSYSKQAALRYHSNCCFWLQHWHIIADVAMITANVMDSSAVHTQADHFHKQLFRLLTHTHTNRTNPQVSVPPPPPPPRFC